MYEEKKKVYNHTYHHGVTISRLFFRFTSPIVEVVPYLEPQQHLKFLGEKEKIVWISKDKIKREKNR